MGPKETQSFPREFIIKAAMGSVKAAIGSKKARSDPGPQAASFCGLVDWHLSSIMEQQYCFKSAF